MWLLLLLLMLEKEVAMLIELCPQCVARGLEDALLDAWTEVARIVTQVRAAVELQKAVLAVKAVGSWRCCRCHFGCWYHGLEEALIDEDENLT